MSCIRTTWRMRNTQILHSFSIFSSEYNISFLTKTVAIKFCSCVHGQHQILNQSLPRPSKLWWMSRFLVGGQRGCSGPAQGSPWQGRWHCRDSLSLHSSLRRCKLSLTRTALIRPAPVVFCFIFCFGHFG